MVYGGLGSRIQSLGSSVQGLGFKNSGRAAAEWLGRFCGVVKSRASRD